MPTIKQGVLYQLACVGFDVISNKTISNLYYLISGNPTGGGTYGAPIVGSSTATVLANWKTFYEGGGGPLVLLNKNLQMANYHIRSILGTRYPTLLSAITTVIPGATTTVITSGPSGLLAGDPVVISGVGGIAGLNGPSVIVSTLPGNQLTLANVTTGSYTGGGLIQKAGGTVELGYGDFDLVTSSAVGGVTTDALPNFVTASVRRINPGIGRSWRSGVRLSIVSEVDTVGGRFTPTFITNMTGAMDGVQAVLQNGSAVPGSKDMYGAVFSQKIATQQPTPFTTALPFYYLWNSVVVDPGCGSLVRRKPKPGS